MTEQNQQELNKKLAENQGFIVTCVRLPSPREPKGVICFFTSKEAAENGEIPNTYFAEELFTQSLDACFKWLVKDNWAVSINSKRICLLTIPRKKGTYGSDLYIGKGNPALSLCLAIEKLIDSGKGKE